jgi:hypothetical protein
LQGVSDESDERDGERNRRRSPNDDKYLLSPALGNEYESMDRCITFLPAIPSDLLE